MSGQSPHQHLRRRPPEARLQFQPEVIKTLMRERGMTPAELADAAGMACHLLGGWASGFTVPRLDSVKLFAERLGVPWEQFYSPARGAQKENAARAARPQASVRTSGRPPVF